MLTLQEVLDDFALYAELEPDTVSVDTKNALGEAPVHWMAALGDVPAIQLLAKAGADLRSQNQSGNTALHVAVASGHLPAAQALIAAGATLTLRNHLDQTPEDLARSLPGECLVSLFAKS
ncbi:MAG: ankyrin repeat domain-containing protein [Betaproteobacteria bacterium]|nr:ankyrin repeat domain-containing protein [Betaproteobacteria bacterium]